MTKVYAGNDTWEIHLDSGQSFVLTQDEIDEIVIESGGYEDIEIERDEATAEKEDLIKGFSKLVDKIEDWKEKEFKRPSKKALVDDIILDFEYIIDCIEII